MPVDCDEDDTNEPHQPALARRARIHARQAEQRNDGADDAE